MCLKVTCTEKKMDLGKFGDNHKGKASEDWHVSVSFSEEKINKPSK